MLVDWTLLRHALADMRHAGVTLPIWWRDDDAVAPSAALDKLHALATDLDLPAHIAVIPDLAETALAETVTARPQLIPMVHGWRHENNAVAGAKKAEFGAYDPQIAIHIHAAKSRMDSLFAGNFMPVFVPPWNRFDPAYVPDLRTAGYLGLSTFLPRTDQWVGPGVVQINTHIDPIDWRGTRGLVDPVDLIEHTIQLLRARREGRADATEPLGFLTHHLVHDEDLWDFSRQFLSELLQGGAHAQPLAPLLEPPA